MNWFGEGRGKRGRERKREKVRVGELEEGGRKLEVGVGRQV